MEPIQLKFTIWHLFRLLDVGILPLMVFYFAVIIVSTALLLRAVRKSMRSKILKLIAALAVFAMAFGALELLYHHVRYESLRQFCMDAVQGGRAPRTASRYLDILEESGRNPLWCTFQRGVVALQMRNYDEACRRFSKIVKESPSHEIAWFNLIQSEMSARRLKQAARFLEDNRNLLSAAAPGKFSALEIRLLLLQGEKERAIVAIKEAIKKGYLPNGFKGVKL